MKARMEGLMKAEGLPIGDRTHTFNSRRAQEMAKWAEIQGGGEGVHDALYRAYFVDGGNLADLTVLSGVAAGLGLDPSAAREAITSGAFADAVDHDWQRARSLGVTGVPTFVVGRQGVVGAQPYTVIEQLVVRGGAARRSRPPSGPGSDLR